MPVLLIATVMLFWFVFFCWYPMIYMLPTEIDDAIFKHEPMKNKESDQIDAHKV